MADSPFPRDPQYEEPDEAAYASATLLTPFRAIAYGVRSNLRGRPAQIMLVFLLTTLAWGYHGELTFLHSIWPAWDPHDIGRVGRAPLFPGVPWDRELIVFGGGALLVVVTPILTIKLWFKESLTDYGLGLPPPGRRRFAALAALSQVLLWAGPFYGAAKDPVMQATYPEWKMFESFPQFLLYECCAFLFFLSIEFMFRGFLMYGLARPDASGTRWGDSMRTYALFFQMLAYVTWHLGKPNTEVSGLMFWGLISGALVLACRSIWPIVLVHWALNVFMHALILGYL